MLAANEVCKRVKAVEIGAAKAVLDQLSFVAVGQSSPQKYKCDVVLPQYFPAEIETLLCGLDLGGETARAVIRKLAPGQSIPPHIDSWMPAEANWRRFQIPLTSHPDIKMRWPDDGVEEHLEPGYLYEVRFDRAHEVINPTEHSRIHIQVDQVNATI